MSYKPKPRAAAGADTKQQQQQQRAGSSAGASSGAGVLSAQELAQRIKQWAEVDMKWRPANGQ